jgi:hypothetical protein
MERVFKAFGRAVVSQLHPKMLALLLLPFFVSIVFWIAAAVLAWDPLTGWLASALFDGGWLGGVYGWAQGIGLGGVREWIPALIAVLLVLPASWVTAVVLVAVFAMPLVMRFLAARDYPELVRRGTASPLPGLWNVLLALAIFAFGYLLTLPLWLIPPLALVVPWLLWSWLSARVMRLDSLIEFADPEERRLFVERYRREYFLLGMTVSVLNYIPPLFLITPVLSALAFGHYSLALLRARRQSEAGGPRRYASAVSNQRLSP